MSLGKLTIAGYKSIERAEVEIRPLNVLIGANGAGKSNFIAIFELLRDLVEGRLQAHVARRGGADTLLRFGRATTPSISFEFEFGPNGYWVELVPSEDDGLFFDEEVCSFHADDYPRPYEESLGSGHRESRLRRAAQDNPGKVAAHVLDAIKSWRVYHFHDTSATARVKLLGDLGDNETLRSDAANLAAFLFRLERDASRNYQLITKMVQRVAPFFRGFKLRPYASSDEKIRLEWEERDSDAYFNAHSLSDGTLRFICLTTLLLQPELPSVILLDEPELGLHPFAIKLLASMLEQAAARTRVIVSTQSTSLVDQFGPSDLVIVDRDPSGGGSSFRRPGTEEVERWVDGYSLGELWEKNIFGGHPR